MTPVSTRLILMRFPLKYMLLSPVLKRVGNTSHVYGCFLLIKSLNTTGMDVFADMCLVRAVQYKQH